MNSINHANGYLMAGDRELGKIEDGILTEKNSMNEKYLPLFFKNKNNADMWLETRVIDKGRINSRKLKKALLLKDKDDISTALYVYGATITDNYWIKPYNEDISYKDIAFTKNSFDLLALEGDLTIFAYSKPERTPELTNTGSYEKCWKREEGNWYLYKKGSNGDFFAELFAYRLGEFLGCNMAKYELDSGYIKSLNFTEGKYNLEPMAHLIWDNDDYLDNYDLLMSMDSKLAKQYIDIILMDTLIFNTDRHTYNYGFLRSQETGEIKSMAPNFDNNQAYGATNTGFKLKPQEDLLLRFFSELVTERKIQFDLPEINFNEVFKIVDDIDLPVPEIKAAIKEYLPLRYEQLEKVKEKVPRRDLNELQKEIEVQKTNIEASGRISKKSVERCR